MTRSRPSGSPGRTPGTVARRRHLERGRHRGADGEPARPTSPPSRRSATSRAPAGLNAAVGSLGALFARWRRDARARGGIDAGVAWRPSSSSPSSSGPTAVRRFAAGAKPIQPLCFMGAATGGSSSAASKSTSGRAWSTSWATRMGVDRALRRPPLAGANFDALRSSCRSGAASSRYRALRGGARRRVPLARSRPWATCSPRRTSGARLLRHHRASRGRPAHAPARPTSSPPRRGRCVRPRPASASTPPRCWPSSPRPGRAGREGVV